MKILHVISELKVGGAESIVLSLTDAAARAGHESAVAAGPGALVERLEGTFFPLPVVARRPLSAVQTSWRLAKILRAWQPDLVHCHNPGSSLIAAGPTFRGCRPRAIVSVHGVPEKDYRNAARLLRLAGIPVVACGPGVAAALGDRGVRVHATIVNGVSPAPAPAERRALYAELDISASFRLVVAVGRLERQKNHELAIAAFRAVPGAVLVIIGTGTRLNQLRLLARDAGVEDRVKFVGERLDARAVLGAADAVVITSHWEGLSLVALEALAAGIPLVATAVRGVRELVRPDIEALLVPSGDSVALAAALTRVLDDPQLGARLASAGKLISAQYRQEIMVEEFLDLYRSMAFRSARKARSRNPIRRSNA